MATTHEVLDFWLREIGPGGWYAGTPEIDAQCRARMEADAVRLRDGGLEHWRDGPAGTLAYLILADQMPRNIWRGSALAFAADGRARAAARRALGEGWDLLVPAPERQFLYLPFEHSEDMADQDLSVWLFAARLPSSPDNLLHAMAHREVIRSFGRFPFRNAALGRADTPAEAEFLGGGGYGTVVAQLRRQGVTGHASGA